MIDSIQRSELPDVQSADPRFAFSGAVEELLRARLAHDMQEAKLSNKFKIYYRIRHLIPIPIRQLLQKGRNRNTEVARDWFIDQQFCRQFAEAIQKDASKKTLPLWPEDARVCICLTHDVETNDGVNNVLRIADIEERYGFRSVWNFIPYKYKVDPGLIAELKDRGHEIGIHGYNHDGRLFENRATFEKRVKSINKAIDQFDAVGFRTPMVHRNLDWQQALEVDWDASCFDIDPFQAMPGGVGGVWPFIYGRFVELPYTLPQDHTLFVSLGETDKRIWVEKYRLLRKLNGLVMLITHPDYLGSESRLGIYEDFLDYLSKEPGCWKALPNEVSKWWRKRDAALSNSSHPGRSDDNPEFNNQISIVDLFGIEDDWSEMPNAASAVLPQPA